MKINNKLFKYILFVLVSMNLILTGCQDDFLEKDPLDRLSEGTFWQSRTDAMLALAGVYERESQWAPINGWDPYTTMLAYMTDEGREKRATNWAIGIDYVPTNGNYVVQIWRFNYRKISRCNYFLESIDKVDLDPDEKAEMIAEVRFLRAYSYFLLSHFYGGVPLVTNVLTFDEANSIERDSYENVVNFTLSELTAAAQDLPITRPSAEIGRVEKGAALAIKGRLLMAEKRWSEAAQTYKEIIDLDRYEIDPRYKELFEQAGDNSNEIIFARHHIEGLYGEPATQRRMFPFFYGTGWNELIVFQEFVDKFLMIDGKTIEESPLYDPDNSFENRDPRLYASVFLPGYTVFRGVTYQGHPDSTSSGVGHPSFPGHTGYPPKKFTDEGYTGNISLYGGDYKLVRYAEVLLSYLESKLEAGDNITQSLLDETINQVRGRDEIDMPSVNETNPEILREIIRRERAVELGLEAGIRYWDIKRWGIAEEILNNKFHGMRLTDDPDTYAGGQRINEEGYLISAEKRFEPHWYVFPIPQSEIDINPNLKQNPGY